MYQSQKQYDSIVSQYFPNDQGMMLSSYSWIKDPYKVLGREIYFNVIEFKMFIDMGFDFTL